MMDVQLSAIALGLYYFYYKKKLNERKLNERKRKIRQRTCCMTTIHQNRTREAIITKKEALRKHFKIKKDSICSGAGSDDIYEPIWFAYLQLVESFLLSIYTSKATLNTETQSMIENELIEDKENFKKENHCIMEPGPSSSYTNSTNSVRKNNPMHRSQSESIEKKSSAFTQLANAINQGPSQLDECDLYANLLASRLREIPKDRRRLYMQKIDMIFYADNSEFEKL
ncbi:uncharacterized protein [Halyomorpha halys]|uniref:uncharacterized protein isoform X2 n=1 Tax=Halyomorpha halys TaxID=286706 RepID=UPI0034D1F5AD